MPSVRTESLEAYLEQGGAEPAAPIADGVDDETLQATLLASLSERDRNLYIVSRGFPRSRLPMSTIAAALHVHRTTVWRRLQRIEAELRARHEPPAIRRCQAPDCGKPLPPTSTRRRRYCDKSSRCRVAAHRSRRRK